MPHRRVIVVHAEVLLEHPEACELAGHLRVRDQAIVWSVSSVANRPSTRT
jgi:hypothetical protein